MMSAFLAQTRGSNAGQGLFPRQTRVDESKREVIGGSCVLEASADGARENILVEGQPIQRPDDEDC